jgi:hypothetical protein
MVVGDEQLARVHRLVRRGGHRAAVVAAEELHEDVEDGPIAGRRAEFQVALEARGQLG